MTKNKLKSLFFLKKCNVFDVFFFITFLTSLIITITLEKEDLLYSSPLVIVSIILKYVTNRHKKSEPLFLLAMLAFLCINILTFYSFHDYFNIISLLTSGYLILFTLLLKKYLIKSKLKSLLSLSVIIGIALVGYLIYAVVDLLIGQIPDNNLIFVFVCALCLFIYAFTFAVIYINDNYANGIILLTSGIATIFNLGLSPINEYFFYTRTFTVVILICHYMSLYLFMKFITETKVIEAKDIKPNYF
ncbi:MULTISPECIES: hypothetical protein [unclassified Olleya]|uniref:hypothetical protein n=1 Tax=unclassified Olleya TaxID=2615019 RepID=UPI000C313027|nr:MULTISPECIES: hypothetical protein [unclassified Olleya]AUC76548.1 hypothetical protein CW732_13055 [Olleya sp. Bg11-27]QXP58860.1 hypothetical protein H0I26_13175 [Olleya sp. HaHaR_3_96]